MRTFPLLVACPAALAPLWGLAAFAGQEFWWQYPLARASLVVAVYWTALALVLVGTGAAALLILLGPGRRIVGAFALVPFAWLLLVLLADSTRADLEEFSGVASGRLKPADISYSVELQRIRLNGALNFGSAARFKEVLESAPQARVVELNSPGGYVVEARWISRQIEQRGLDTLVAQMCASACVDIFASGRQRVMYPNAVVGLHSASGADAPRIAAVNQAFENRLYRLGVEPRFLMYGTDTPASEIWINTARQAYLAGLATHVVDPTTANGRP